MQWQRGAREQDAWTYCSFDGAATTLTIVRHDRDLSHVTPRAVMALAICVAAWFGMKLRRYTRLRDALSRWPHLFGVVVGLAWWLWLAPSAVGWLIVAVFLASSLRPTWRSRAIR
jgi:hypothetical protein